MKSKTILKYASFILGLSTNLNASVNLLLDESKFTRGKTEVSCGSLAWISNKATENTPIVFLHGNSACKEVFVKQLVDSDLNKYPLISVDLPGHGESSDAKDPVATYSFEGYAAAIQELLEKKNLKNAIICGWSLGGHIALSLASQSPQSVQGLFLTGTPPIEHSMEGMMSGFKPFEGAHMMSQESQFTKEEAMRFTNMGGIDSNEAEFMITAGQRTHGLARKNMIGAALCGSGINEKSFITATKIPVAFVQGAQDNGINGDYINALPIQNKVAFHTVTAGHATFWEADKIFNTHLADFVKGIEAGKK